MSNIKICYNKKIEYMYWGIKGTLTTIILIVNILWLFNYKTFTIPENVAIILNIIFVILGVISLLFKRIFFFLKVKKIIKNKNMDFNCKSVYKENSKLKLVAFEFNINIKVQMKFFSMNWIEIITKTELSYSKSKYINLEFSNNSLELKYEYKNIPIPKKDEVLKKHFGFGELKFIKNEKEMFSYYNNDNGRISYCEESKIL